MSLRLHPRSADARTECAQGKSNWSPETSATAAILVLLFATSFSCAGASSVSPLYLSSWLSPKQQQQQSNNVIQAVRGGASENAVILRFKISVPNLYGNPSSVYAAGDDAQLGSWLPEASGLSLFASSKSPGVWEGTMSVPVPPEGKITLEYKYALRYGTDSEPSEFEWENRVQNRKVTILPGVMGLSLLVQEAPFGQTQPRSTIVPIAPVSVEPEKGFANPILESSTAGAAQGNSAPAREEARKEVSPAGFRWNSKASATIDSMPKAVSTPALPVAPGPTKAPAPTLARAPEAAQAVPAQAPSLAGGIDIQNNLGTSVGGGGIEDPPATIGGRTADSGITPGIRVLSSNSEVLRGLPDAEIRINTAVAGLAGAAAVQVEPPADATGRACTGSGASTTPVPPAMVTVPAPDGTTVSAPDGTTVSAQASESTPTGTAVPGPAQTEATQRAGASEVTDLSSTVTADAEPKRRTADEPGKAPGPPPATAGAVKPANDSEPNLKTSPPQAPAAALEAKAVPVALKPQARDAGSKPGRSLSGFGSLMGGLGSMLKSNLKGAKLGAPARDACTKAGFAIGSDTHSTGSVQSTPPPAGLGIGGPSFQAMPSVVTWTLGLRSAVLTGTGKPGPASESAAALSPPARSSAKVQAMPSVVTWTLRTPHPPASQPTPTLPQAGQLPVPPPPAAAPEAETL